MIKGVRALYSSRKGIANHLISVFKLSERRVCSIASISRTAYRYVPVPRSGYELRARLNELADKHQGLGFEMLHDMPKTASSISVGEFYLFHMMGSLLEKRSDCD